MFYNRKKSTVRAILSVNYMDDTWVIITINTFTLNRFYSYVTRKVYTVFINGGRTERPGFECMKTRLGRPWLQITDHNKNGVL